MSTFATHEGPTLAELDERARTAWGAHRENLVDLDGVAYDAAERAEWEFLQTVLHEIAAQRTAAKAAAAAPGS